MALLAGEAALARKLPEALEETVNLLAGLLFLAAFSRVLLADLLAAAGSEGGDGLLNGVGGVLLGGGDGALPAALSAVGNAIQTNGPSLLIGILLIEALKRAPSLLQSWDEEQQNQGQPTSGRRSSRSSRSSSRSSRSSSRSSRSTGSQPSSERDSSGSIPSVRSWLSRLVGRMPPKKATSEGQPRPGRQQSARRGGAKPEDDEERGRWWRG